MNLAILLLLATANVTVEGGGEVCRFRAGDSVNPFGRWLASQEVTCVPAGPGVEFPTGLWNVFARSKSALSAAPFLIDGDKAPSTLSLKLDPAASVLTEASGVIYAPRRVSAFPISGGRVLVPANEPLWLFVIEKAKVVAVHSIAPLLPGSEHRVDARGAGTSSVIGWLHVPETHRNAIDGASGLTPPVVRVGTRDSDLLPPLSSLHGAFIRVRDVPPGHAELRLEGRGWVAHRRVVKVEPGVNIVADPLIVRVAGSLAVHWSTQQDLPALDRSLESCDGSDNASQIEIVVSSCPEFRPGTVPDHGPCTVIREEKFDPAPFGEMTVDDLAPGAYRAALRFGKLPVVANNATVAPLQQRDLRLIAEYRELYGSVTHGGEPLGERVRVEFPSGSGFAPDDTDEYRALVRGFFGIDTPILVAACDGDPRAIVLSDEEHRPRTRFNVDIPANELTLNVSDTFTREALDGATVRVDVMSLRTPRRMVMDRTLTTSNGSVTLKAVPERELRITVSLAGYQKQGLEPFTMPRSEKKTIDVQLVPLRGSRGKIASDRPFESGTVVWFTPSGIETERTDLASDGTFVYASAHAPGETMAVISLSHPLWVLHTPPVERREVITVRYPNAPVRAFEVSVASTDHRPVGLVIAGLRVPPSAIAQHQTLRRDSRLQFRDLLGTGPIDVILGEVLRRVGVDETTVVME